MTEDFARYKEEIDRVAECLLAKKQEAALTFCVTADSHLDNAREISCSNRKAVDQKAKMDFQVHLGDFLNGSFARVCTAGILREEMERYVSASPKGVFYPVQGNHDGFANYTTSGIRRDITLDEDWYEATAFTEGYKHVVRKPGKPYFYADYPEQKVRLIILCSFSYRFTDGGTAFQADPCNYQKLYEMDPEQLTWFREEALAVDSAWTVMLFSHDGPLELFDQKRFREEPWTGTNRELLRGLLEAKATRGFSVAGWFIGHWHGDLLETVEGIPFILVGDQTAYVPQLWSMPDTGGYAPREVGTVSEDLWDAVVLNTRERKLFIYRFGAGEDREVSY